VGAAEQDDEPVEALELRVLHEVLVFINVRFAGDACCSADITVPTKQFRRRTPTLRCRSDGPYGASPLTDHRPQHPVARSQQSSRLRPDGAQALADRRNGHLVNPQPRTDATPRERPSLAANGNGCRTKR
jgi:hypothetical protein